jgi:UDP-4-amino-4,6-dideoxy-N-acetyl-beta-L-altrosamine transaminase
MIPYGKQDISQDDIDCVVSVLRGDWITTGPKIEEYEETLSNYVGVKHAIAVNSGTSALDIAYTALELPKGSEVITTPFTFAATSNMIIANGMTPVFVDIQSDTFNLDPQKIKEKITDRTRAISYVDYAGHPCDINPIKEIAEKHDLFVIEDAAHALGAEYEKRKVGSFADITEFSFHPVKHITTGEGGACTTNNEELAAKMKLLRNHGMDKNAKERFGKDADYSYDIKRLGRNCRITDFQCALGISQMKRLDGFVKKRKELAKRYDEELEGVDQITLPSERENVSHAWHLYTILLDKDIKRDKFFSQMKEKGIGVNVHYIPLYHFSYYKENFNFKKEDYRVTEEVFSRIITLPLFPQMKEDELEHVVKTIKELVA